MQTVALTLSFGPITTGAESVIQLWGVLEKNRRRYWFGEELILSPTLDHSQTTGTDSKGLLIRVPNEEPLDNHQDQRVDGKK